MIGKLNFCIPGHPKGKERPRFVPGMTRPITPKKTLEYERMVLQIFKARFPGHEPFVGPVMVRMTAVFPIPKSFTVAQRRAALEGKMFCTSKPDKDNIEKAIYDALNGAAWVDDSQVSGGCIKRYGSPARIDVTIEPMVQEVDSAADRRRKAKLAQPELVMGRPVRK